MIIASTRNAVYERVPQLRDNKEMPHGTLGPLFATIGFDRTGHTTTFHMPTTTYPHAPKQNGRLKASDFTGMRQNFQD